MKNHALPCALTLAALAVCFGLASQLSAQTTWNRTAVGTSYLWNLNTNWTPDTVPNAAGAVVNLNNNIAGDQIISLPTGGITVGTLNLGDSDAVSTFTLNSNTLTFQSASPGGTTQLNTIGTATINSGVTLGGTSPLAISSSVANRLSLVGTITTNGNNINFSGGTAATNQFSITGDIVGAGTMTNNSNASVSFTGNKTFTGTLVANRGIGTGNTGSFTLTTGSMANAAEFVISGALSGSGTTQSGGSIWSGDNAASSVNPGQRLTQNRLTLNGGTLTANGQALTALPSGIIQDTVANFDFNSGYSLVTIVSNATTAGTRLNATILERSAGATGFVRSNALGGTARFTVGNVNSFLIGGGGAEASTTMSIIPWLVAANTNASGATGTDFATNGANGIRALVTAEYATSITSGSTTTNNVRIASVGTLASPTTINSLIKTSAGVDNIGSTLTITSGAVLFNNPSAGIGIAGNIAAGTLNFGTAEGVVWANGTAANSIGAVISGSGGFSKAGTGTLTITGNNSYSGLTYVSGGTLIVGDGTNASRLGITGNVTVANGAILSLMNNATISDLATLTLENFGGFNGMITLAPGIDETVGSLFFGTASQAVGTWGSTASTATFQNNAYFSGAGILTVVPEPSTAVLLGVIACIFFIAMRRRRA